MKIYLHSSLLDEKRCLGHELEGPLNAHRSHGNLTVQRQEESPPLEELKLSIPAPGSFRKYQEGIPLLLDQTRGLIYTLFSSLQSLPVHRDETHQSHGLTDNRNAEGFFFQDNSYRLRNDHEQQWAVKRTQVVAHEHIGCFFVDILEAGHLQTHSHNPLPEAHRPFPERDKRLGPPYQKTEDYYRDEEDRDKNIDNKKDDRAHDSMQRLYHTFSRKRNYGTLVQQQELSLDIHSVLDEE